MRRSSEAGLEAGDLGLSAADGEEAVARRRKSHQPDAAVGGGVRSGFVLWANPRDASSTSAFE